MDEDAKAVRREAGKNRFDWPQAWLGADPVQGPAAALQVGSVPLYLIVAPDGTVAVRTEVWAEAEAYLREKLGG